MKKRILIIALALVLTLSLCSCDYLDELKATQFTWTDGGFSTLVSRDGKEYKALPLGTSLEWTYFGDYSFGYLLEPDVPLLLGSAFGSGVCFYKNSGIIEMTGEFPRCYCRADRYDEVLDFINSEDGDVGFCYFSYETYEYIFRVLTDKEKAIIDNALANAKKETEINEDYFEYLITSVYRVSEELGIEVHKYDLSLRSATENLEEKEYFVEVYDKNGDKTSYPIPKEFSDVFDNIASELGF